MYSTPYTYITLLLATHGCPNGWMEDSETCFKAFEGVKDWSETKEMCRAEKASLVKIPELRYQEFIQRFLLNGNVTKTVFWKGNQHNGSRQLNRSKFYIRTHYSYKPPSLLGYEKPYKSANIQLVFVTAVFTQEDEKHVKTGFSSDRVLSLIRNRGGSQRVSHPIEQLSCLYRQVKRRVILN